MTYFTNTSPFANTRSRACSATRQAVFLCFGILFSTLAAATASAQDDPPQYELAPPPLMVMSKAERDKLDMEQGIRKRTQLALELMDARVGLAETANTRDDLNEMFSHLGAFSAIMEDTLAFLKTADPNRGRTLDNFKRLEIGLRRFSPRLELIRRELPLTHEFYVRSLLRQLRDARSRALDPLFDDSVIRSST
ncbi:MAG: hypothetical protein KF831_11705 [Acidobacteria bacterium]|nr:hypothetical protein [Acidobacteriota bacterium]